MQQRVIEETVLKSQASLEKRDLDVLIRMAQPIEPKVVLEIGTWKGHSASVWINAFDPDLLITIEKDKIHSDAVVHNNPNYHYLWETDSNSLDTRAQVIDLLNGRYVDFLFIDGDHNYGIVEKDWELYSGLVSNGGVIAMHDVQYVSDQCQTKLLWDKIKTNYYYIESNIGEGSTGMGIIFYEGGERTAAQKSQDIENVPQVS